MINRTSYTTKEIRAYIKWRGWKFQPSSHWERNISDIVIVTITDPYRDTNYEAIVVYDKTGVRDVTIPIDQFRSFLKFHYITKPKQFKLRGKQ